MFTIDRERCVNCGICARTCPMGVIYLDKEGSPAVREGGKCLQCFHCTAACPTQAITHNELGAASLPLQADDGSMLAKFRRRRIGFVFQSYNLLQEHTALENIYMPLNLDGRKPDPEHLERVLRLLEIQDLVKKYPTQLSGGEQQRVAIARAIVAKPDIVLADEPTGNLDPKTSQQTLDLLKATVHELGQTLILVTHDMDVAAQAEVMIRIHQGEIVEITEQ